MVATSQLDHLDDDRVTLVGPVLEEGHYDLELTLDGYRDLIVPVDIAAGRTIELLDLVLERR